MNRPARFRQAEIRRAMRAAKSEGCRAFLLPDGRIEIDPTKPPVEEPKPNTQVAPPKGFAL